MSGTTPWQAQSNIEPIAAATIGAIANFVNFNTLSGCAATYNGANMNIAIAAGLVTHTANGVVSSAGNVLLVSDPTNPRWAYSYINSSGVPSIVSSSAAATPAVPDPGANPTNGLTYVQAGLTIATNATYKLDKRVFAPPTGFRIVKPLIETVNGSNTLQDDNDFAVPMTTGYDYQVSMFLRLATNTTADFKFAFTLTGSTWDGQYDSTIDNSTVSVITDSQGITSGSAVVVGVASVNATAAVVKVNATIHAGSTGTMHFQWAQNTGDASNTSLLKNSWMTYVILGAT